MTVEIDNKQRTYQYGCIVAKLIFLCYTEIKTSNSIVLHKINIISREFITENQIQDIKFSNILIIMFEMINKC